MGTFFKDIAGGVEKVQSGFLGPTNNYAKQIKPPTHRDLNMSGDGNMGALARDIAGIINYTEVLVSGKSKAQTRNSPLGNKFYIKTGGQCKGPDNNLHERWFYVNNVPTGSIPFISSATGGNFGDFRGLVPGTIENLGHINPLALFSGFMQGTNPKCRKLNLKADDGKINLYVADSDISDLDPCLWDDSTNPVSKSKKSGCAKGFKNMNEIMSGAKDSFKDITLKDNPLANIYNLGFSALLIYLLFNLITKKGD